MRKAIETFPDCEQHDERGKSEDMGRLNAFLHEIKPDAAARVAMLILDGADFLKSIPDIGCTMDDDTGSREWIHIFWVRGLCSSLYVGQKRHRCYYSCLAQQRKETFLQQNFQINFRRTANFKASLIFFFCC
jgi:hypothetical protein